MSIEAFHIRGTAKRRGDHLPARLRFSAHRGVTLVELMISMLILTLVCVAWLEIIGIQSAKKEARRREAVERLAGMMDAFIYQYQDPYDLDLGDYEFNWNPPNRMFIKDPGSSLGVHSMFGKDVSPIVYRISVVEQSDLPNEGFFGNRWNPDHWWLVGRLYNQSEDAVKGNTSGKEDKAFCTLVVYLGV